METSTVGPKIESRSTTLNLEQDYPWLPDRARRLRTCSRAGRPICLGPTQQRLRSPPTRYRRTHRESYSDAMRRHGPPRSCRSPATSRPRGASADRNSGAGSRARRGARRPRQARRRFRAPPLELSGDLLQKLLASALVDRRRERLQQGKFLVRKVNRHIRPLTRQVGAG